MPSPNESHEILSDLNRLSKQDLLQAIQTLFPVPDRCVRSKPRLLQFIVENVPLDIVKRLQKQGQDHPSGRRRRLPSASQDSTSSSSNSYMSLPSQSVIKQCYREFCRNISNDVLRKLVCGVCAREEDPVSDSRIQCQIPIREIPNAYKLVPSSPHPCHPSQFDGLLLEPAGTVQRHGEILVNICSECYYNLQKTSGDPPKFSLANDLWIGPVPEVLSALSFTESILLSLVIPRIFVFKLYPKCHYDVDPEELQKGLRGNVVSYDQDIQGVADMVHGGLLPRPLQILPSVITIAFVGKGKLSLKALSHHFSVRRDLLRRALEFLIHYNRYYELIRIDYDVLSQFPENAVPTEISSMVRHLDDDKYVERETQPYVPDEDGIGCEADDTQPGVFPLNISGGTDMDMNTVCPSDVLKSGIANLWAQGREGAYAVRHGQHPVRDFPWGSNTSESEQRMKNYFGRAFPTLFPYGVGLPESPRAVPLDLKSYVQWCLRYHDQRFRRHDTFPFVVYGILQKRCLLESSRIQMNRQGFERDAQNFARLTPEQLQKAAEEEAAHKPISNPVVRNLFSQVHTIASRAQGSNSSKYRLRSETWATMMWMNVSALWMTINPCDLHNPVAQIFAGEEIDMDQFEQTIGPNARDRARNIAADPYAAAQFFHFLIRLVLKTLFHVEVSPYQVKSTMGVLGEIAAYFGVVESQGRGSLHLHMMLWLKNAPSAEEIHQMLETPEFRQRVREYISRTIHAYVPGLESADSVQRIPNEVDIAYRPPPNPDSPNFDAEFQDLELKVARSKQIHTCSESRCLVFNKRANRYFCKRRAPFDLAMEDFIEASGKWGPKRLYNMVNAYCPHVSVFLPCNNDLKLITNGEDTKNCSYYYSTYMTKNQPSTTNLSSIVAKQYTFEQERVAVDPRYLMSLDTQQQMVLFRIANRMTADQEIAAPMLISYLMDWNDHFTSHKFTSVFWNTFVGFLLRLFPDLARQSRVEVAPDAREHHDDDDEEESHEDDMDNVELIVDVRGCISAKNQVTDYVYRGEALAFYNVYEFFKDTWEDRRLSRQSSSHDPSTESRRGRPSHTRVLYLSQHPSWDTRCRVIRAPGHNNLPNFLGHYFPRNDDSAQKGFYCASMLMLFKPWRNLATDLKTPLQTWDEAWESFLVSCKPWIRRVVNNIQYYYESRASVEQERQSIDLSPMVGESTRVSTNRDIMGMEVNEDDFDMSLDPRQEDMELEMRQFTESEKRRPDEMYAQAAVRLGEMSGLFPSFPSCSLSSPPSPDVRVAEGDDLVSLANWKRMLEPTTVANSASREQEPEVRSTSNQGPCVYPITHIPDLSSECGEDSPMSSIPKTIASVPSLASLNPEQRRQFDIVQWYLDRTLAGFPPSPLRQQLIGAGGVGKSRVIDAITELFEARNVRHLLAKAAFTGIAAVIIHGETLHHLCRIPVKGSGRFHITAKAKKELIEVFRQILFLIIDELSMLFKEFLALISYRISVAKAAEHPELLDKTFGGINVILAGDLHQFPPVSVKRHELLYKPLPMYNVSKWTKLGDMIYHEFDKVVMLRRQIRVQDEVWQEFLDCLRQGTVQTQHLEMLRGLILKPGEFSDMGVCNPWMDAPLITPRHSVRRLWNSASIRRYCQLHNRQLFICPAQETIEGRVLTARERLYMNDAIRDHLAANNRKDLPDEVELAVGASVLVTRNLDTDLDVANGARGVIERIVLDPREPRVTGDPVVRLTYPPVYVLVKLDHTRAPALPGLNPSVIPIEPVVQHVNIYMRAQRGQPPLKRQVCRIQLPMTPAYAFTDYRSQGQTLSHVIVDIARPVTGPRLSLFNVYVALSRSKGRSTIRLLRDFEDYSFSQKIDPDLHAEDLRLEKLDEETTQWWDGLKRGSGSESL